MTIYVINKNLIFYQAMLGILFSFEIKNHSENTIEHDELNLPNICYNKP
jgi:hypothetical protein